MANQTIYPYGPNGQLPSGIGVVNDVETGGTTDALSAEQGKNLGYDVQLLVEQLADSAFIGERPDLKDVRTAISTTVTVTIETSHATVSNEKTSCVLGASYKNSVLNERGYVISSVTVTMGGTDITSSCYDSGARTIVIDEVTGNITIACTAVENTNPHYYRLVEKAGTGKHWVEQEGGSLLTKYYNVTPGYSKSITFNSGSVSRSHCLIEYNSNGNYIDYYMDNASPRTVTVSENAAGMRQNITYSLMSKAVLVNNTDNITLFDGTKFNFNDSIDGLRYFDQFANSNGDLVGVKILANGKLQAGIIAADTTTDDWITSKLVALPSGSKNVIFSVGETDSTCHLISLSAEDALDSTYIDYFVANAAPRTVSLNYRYNYVRLMMKKSQYANSYIAIGEDILWQGTNEFVE